MPSVEKSYGPVTARSPVPWMMSSPSMEKRSMTRSPVTWTSITVKGVTTTPVHPNGNRRNVNREGRERSAHRPDVNHPRFRSVRLPAKSLLHSHRIVNHSLLLTAKRRINASPIGSCRLQEAHALGRERHVIRARRAFDPDLVLERYIVGIDQDIRPFLPDRLPRQLGELIGAVDLYHRSTPPGCVRQLGLLLEWVSGLG